MKNKKSGFISIILIVVVALVILKYVYNIDVIGFLTQGKFKEFLDQFYNLGNKGWEKYNDIVIKIWSYVIEFIKNIATKIIAKTK